jgi:hypothetical protein
VTARVRNRASAKGALSSSTSGFPFLLQRRDAAARYGVTAESAAYPELAPDTAAIRDESSSRAVAALLGSVRDPASARSCVETRLPSSAGATRLTASVASARASRPGRVQRTEVCQVRPLPRLCACPFDVRTDAPRAPGARARGRGQRLWEERRHCATFLISATASRTRVIAGCDFQPNALARKRARNARGGPAFLLARDEAPLAEMRPSATEPRAKRLLIHGEACAGECTGKGSRSARPRCAGRRRPASSPDQHRPPWRPPRGRTERCEGAPAWRSCPLGRFCAPRSGTWSGPMLRCMRRDQVRGGAGRSASEGIIYAS